MRFLPPMQFVGLLLIVNSLLGAAWWIAMGRPQWVVVPLCVVVMAAGVFLIVHDRATSVKTQGTTTIKSSALEELAGETSKAKALLADLQDQTAAADWHLKQLDERVQETKILPDGRTRVGNTVTGQPVILIQKLEALQNLAAERSAQTFGAAVECVGLYEKTREQTQGVALTGGDLGADTVAWMYMTAATAAQRANEHDRALEWAKAAVAARSTTERQCLLVTALINKNLQAEANEVIQRELKAGGPEAVKFRQYLDQYKIPYNK